MSTIFKSNENIPVPESVGVCPDCDGPMEMDFLCATPLVEEANLYAPGDPEESGEHFGLKCENSCEFGAFDDEPDPNDNTWEERYQTWEERTQAWEAVYEKVDEWLSHTPFLIEGSFYTSLPFDPSGPVAKNAKTPMMRTSRELVDELMNESKLFTELRICVWLGGQFNLFEFVDVHSINAIDALEELRQQGGRPVGVIGFCYENNDHNQKLSASYSRIFPQYERNPKAQRRFGRTFENLKRFKGTQELKLAKTG